MPSNTCSRLAVFTDRRTVLILGAISQNKNLKNGVYGTYHAVTACSHLAWITVGSVTYAAEDWAESPTISTEKVEMLNHQLTASKWTVVSLYKSVAAHGLTWALALLTLSGRERKGEEDGSDRRDEFHGRRGVVDFKVGWGRFCLSLLRFTY